MTALFQEMFRTGLYKRSQGKVTRQATFATIALVIALGCLRMMQVLVDSAPPVRYGVPAVVFLVGCWICYRLVNFPGFADFLIAVEAEMNKVSWPTRSELVRSSLVVMIMIFALAFVLFGFDLAWSYIFRHIIPIL